MGHENGGWMNEDQRSAMRAAAQEPTCAKCGLVMTPENARVHPEFFLHDSCLPEELRPSKAAQTGWRARQYLTEVDIIAAFRILDVCGNNIVSVSDMCNYFSGRERVFEELAILLPNMVRAGLISLRTWDGYGPKPGHPIRVGGIDHYYITLKSARYEVRPVPTPPRGPNQ